MPDTPSPGPYPAPKRGQVPPVPPPAPGFRTPSPPQPVGAFAPPPPPAARSPLFSPPPVGDDHEQADHSPADRQTAIEESGGAATPPIRVTKRIVQRRRSSNGPALAALGVLLLVAGGLGYAVIGQEGIERMIAGKGLAKPSKPAAQVVAQEPSSPAPSPAPAATPAKAPEPQAVVTTATQAVSKPRAPESVPQPVSPPPPPRPPNPSPPQPEIEPPQAMDDETRRAIDEQLARGLEALRNEDFPRAAQAFAVAADRAVVDADVLDRVSRWQLLADYARQFPRHRDAALQAAGEGRDYEIGARKIGVVEMNDREFIYREKGRNIRVPRNAIPDDILLAIVEAWFAGADKAGNHMILGASHITRPRPNPEAARREWSVAASRGEPTGRALLRLLDDPLLETATPR